MQQYLNILGIGFGLSKEEIKKIYYSKAREIHPDINEGIDEKEMMFLNGAYNYMIENFEDYINGISTLRKDSASYYFNEGLVIFYVTKNYKLALKRFNKSLEIDANYADSIHMKGMTQYKLGDPSESIGYLSDAIEKDKKNLLLYLELIEILEKEKRFDEAEKAKSLLKENTPKARPNLHEKFDFVLDPSSRTLHTKESGKKKMKEEIEKEVYNYYKLGFWILIGLISIYFFVGNENIQSYISILVNYFL